MVYDNPCNKTRHSLKRFSKHGPVKNTFHNTKNTSEVNA